jgi:hypothetical protein
MAKELTRAALEALPALELKDLAREAQIKSYGKLRKEALVAALLAANATPVARKTPAAKVKAAAPVPAPVLPTTSATRPAAATPEPEAPLRVVPEASPGTRRLYEQRVAEAKYAVSRPTERLREDERLGDLPSSYGTNLLTLLPLNPNRAYAYWDLDYRRLGEYYQGLSDGQPVVRLFRSHDGQFQPVAELDIDLGAHNHYFPVEAGATYAAELGLRGANGYRKIVASNVLSVPTDRVSERADATFVSIPLEAPLPVAANPAGLGGVPGGKVLTRAEYEQLFGKGVPGIPGSQHR